MRGLDTNVLVRYITDDDPEQSPIAKRLIQDAEDKGDRLYINTVVLCELCWTLRGGRYRYDRPTIAAVLEKILAIKLFEIQNRDLVNRATRDYQLGKADFADYLIGLSNQRAGCEDTVSFDGGVKDLEGFTIF
jgi:predicted nucleic-acid-binding protein